MGLDAGPQPDHRRNVLSLASVLLILPALCVVGQDQWALALPLAGVILGVGGLGSEWRSLGIVGITVNALLVILQVMVLLMGGGDRIPPFF